jgi:predicted transcriptional regulator
MDFYCSTHETLCCFYCIQSTHKQCVGTEHLPKVVENVKFSTSMEDLERNIHDMKINVEKIFEDRVQNISNIDKQKIRSLKMIIDTKKSVVQYLDSLEKQIIDELTELVKRHKSVTDRLLYNLRRKKSKLRRLSDEVTKIKQYASEMDTLLAIKQIGAEIIKEESFLYSLQEDDSLVHTKVSFEKSSEFLESLKNSITSFGRIVINSEPSTISLKQQKKQHKFVYARCYCQAYFLYIE